MQAPAELFGARLFRARFLRTVAAVFFCLAAADLSAEAKTAECSASNSERATVAQIATNPGAYEGRCVAVDGTRSGTTLFDSVDGVYVMPTDPTNPASSGLRIGLDNVSRQDRESYRHVAVVGRVQDCETMRNCLYASAAENEFLMITGYCHHHNGPYLWVRDLRFRRGPPFQRRMGSDARSDYGNLMPAPADWLYRTKIEALANEFLRALQSGDRDELANIHFRNVGLEWEDDEADMLRFLLKDRRSPFSSIRTATTPPQQIILVDRSLQDEDPAEEEYTATVCFCRETDCTRRWPIATFDADNVRFQAVRVHPHRGLAYR